MRVKHRYCMENGKRVQSFLEKYSVPYENFSSADEKIVWCMFDLYEDQENFKMFKLFFPMSFFNSTIEVEYTLKEIESAEWLTIRSVNTKVDREPVENTFEYLCQYKNSYREIRYRHIEQTHPFAARKGVKWKANQFFCGTTATGENYMFCADKTKKIMSEKWMGLEFWPVRKYNTEKEIPDLYQLFFKQVLPFHAVVLQGNEKIKKCEFCGRKKIHINERYQISLDKNYMNNQNKYNVYTTGGIWTYEKMGWHTFPLNIVSHEFYQFCKDEKIDRGLSYEPIKLV